ncbi:hypothetical protein IE81DRAFT_287912 [Ceraceosorus guamensis]|uniref:Uncharacterized protein n=1 Tax=Ceraceosorus guamensis TaxID=1522189 RepID=A0A316W8C5_9BASI|nr:hypothetical protein IE81DRAFT_287912 [Ceraceosorus guamensis]PWN43935.1 hypothetical protein IE81DRAFT_287912 [Ceraceosorus guamensis]
MTLAVPTTREVAAEKRQLSIPDSLIPGINDNITSILQNILGPLPILQAPTPALSSPPFKQLSIKPKKVGYYWTGAEDRKHKDFLAVVSHDDDTFGQFVNIAEVPTSGNEPHHIGASADGKTLVGGGLLSLLKTQDTAFYFDISDPYAPKFKKSNRALLASITDEIRAKPDGGFFITYMGSAAGTSPGRLVETNADFDIIGQWPQSLDSINALTQQFSPHGLSIDWKNNWILTSDYVVPLSVLKPSTGIQRANTLRLWTLHNREIVNTITIPRGGGIQDVKFIPNNPDGAAIATAVHLGQIWIIYPNRKDANGKQGTAELLFDLGPRARDSTAIYTAVSNDGKFLYGSITTGNHVFALDISDLKNIKRLDNPDEQQKSAGGVPVLGPHFLSLSPDQKTLTVTDYFVRTGDIGILNTPGNYFSHVIDILPNGGLSFNRTIDFAGRFPDRGGARPHSSTVFDFTDPENPKWSY